MKIRHIFTKNNIFMLIALLIIMLFLWMRFIKKRLPNDIPFILSIWSFIGLILICTMYIYIIKKKLTKSSSPGILLELVRPFIIKTFKPFIDLNDNLLNKVFYENLIKFCLRVLIKILEIKIVPYLSGFLYAFLFILPRIILALCLIIDCFYHKQLYFFYWCIIVISIPLFIRYLLFCFEKIKQKDIVLLNKYFTIEILSEDLVYTENDYDDEGFLKEHIPRYFNSPTELAYDYHLYEEPFALYTTPRKYLKIDKFLHYQSNEILFKDILYSYKILFHDERLDTFPLDDIFNKNHSYFSKKECSNLLYLYSNVMALNEHINNVKEHHYNKKKSIIRYMDIFINVCLLLCWTHILIKSFPTLPRDSFHWLEYLIPLYDNPFI